MFKLFVRIHGEPPNSSFKMESEKERIGKQKATMVKVIVRVNDHLFDCIVSLMIARFGTHKQVDHTTTSPRNSSKANHNKQKADEQKKKEQFAVALQLI